MYGIPGQPRVELSEEALKSARSSVASPYGCFKREREREREREGE